MSNKKLNPDSITLGDIKKMRQGEFRQWVFLKLNNIDITVHRFDTRLWVLLAGIAVTVAAVVGGAVL